MISRLLVANRGEIARRIMRTCRRLGIETVAVFSDADAGAEFVRDADYAVALGGNTPAESYLRIEAVVAALERTGADAVHPGYGFLAENADFARAVAAAGATFVGPDPEAIAAMGSKLEAKRLMSEAGVPLLPSAELGRLDGDELAAACAEIGYPLLIKASAGGGGRGMRVVADEAKLADAAEAARRESASAFGDDTVYAERYVSPSRHVEVQIFGDAGGRVIHLHERECSIQRRHQKIIEEAPSASIGPATREALHAAAVAAGKAIGYTNAGTVEFLLPADAGDVGDAPADFYFLEVNTRLQVEHPVTEAVLGLDLVELQLSVAAGGQLPEQSAVGPVAGHAIEARLYAEDPTRDYLPSTGTLRAFAVPGPVRVDSAIDQRGQVSQFYDPMIAKVVAHGPDRLTAARTLATSLRRATIDGIRSNRELLVRVLTHDEFLDGRGDSDFLERNDAAALGRPLVAGEALAVHLGAAALARQAWHRATTALTPAVATGFRNAPTTPQRVSFEHDGQIAEVGYRFTGAELVHLAVDGDELADPVLWSATPDAIDLSVAGLRRHLRVALFADRVVVTGPDGSVDLRPVPRFVEPGDTVEAGSLVAAMPGTVVAVQVSEGDTVDAGDTLVVLEAMKMELAVTSPTAGTVTAVPVSVGDTVTAGQVLAVVEG